MNIHQLHFFVGKFVVQSHFLQPKNEKFLKSGNKKEHFTWEKEHFTWEAKSANAVTERVSRLSKTAIEYSKM